MNPELCNICGSPVVSDKYDYEPETVAQLKHDRDFCPDCQNTLEKEFTQAMVENHEEIKQIISTIDEIGEDDDSISSRLGRREKERLNEQVAQLKEAFGVGDETSDEAFERRNSVFIEVSFTYDRASAKIPEEINNLPVINTGNSKSSENVPWKLLEDRGESTGIEGHSRATLVIELKEDGPYVRGHHLTRLEGGVSSINGDWRNNAQAKVLHSAPEWFWEANWGVNTWEDVSSKEQN